MYLTGPDNYAWALDARTGRQIWRYRRQLPERLNICCGRVNRGFAISGGFWPGTSAGGVVNNVFKDGFE